MKTFTLRLLFPLLFLFFFGCASVSDFNQVAYDQSLSIKSDALNLISKAADNYSDHQSEIDSLKLNVEIAYQYSKTIPNNTGTIAQWEIIRDPNSSSLFGLLDRWKSKTQLSGTFISEVKLLIASDFNTIIDFENRKRKPLNN
ncbi:MAG: hypothetical protein P4L35_11575 [Ignavibacteriaceae bacterium]|nr:hypothetical protein [Ignavibacteriaceae bacterium]